MTSLILLLLICAGILILYFKAKDRFKVYVPGTVNVITGAPKTCKSALTLHLALKDYRSRYIHYWIAKNIFFKKNLEKPLFYSNIPLANVHYVPLSNDLLLRKTRFAYGSVIFIDEFYLIADSQMYKDNEINVNLSLLMKLIGHETHGGSVWLNTQNRSDLHYSVKRCCLSYIYIFKKQSIPFFMTLSARELLNSEELDITNTIQDDPQHDLSFRRFFIPKSIFKKYDPYSYSLLTDNLNVDTNSRYQKYSHAFLKQSNILSLKRVKSIYKEVNQDGK